MLPTYVTYACPTSYHICRNICLTTLLNPLACLVWFVSFLSIYSVCSHRPNNTKIEEGKESVMKPKQNETRILILEQNMLLVRI